ncbi:MAG: SDR family oxidoreductase [Deltaproteobacteria bacterium]|nr:SDR family oxidoreductase [Deltaproteobacteria bacterium]
MASPAGEVVLITGYPRLQARRLMLHLLDHEPETEIVLVVLDKLQKEARHRLAELDEAQRRRVQVLGGDAAAMDLGLSGAEYGELAAAVTRIHHLAQVSYVGVDRATAEYANIQGAVEVVELGRAAERLTRIIHHSTAHVSGDRAGTVYEHELDEGQGFHTVVQETRMKAEQVMRRAMMELPISVVRPTMLVGDSVTGQADRFDGPYLLVMLVLGLPGEMAVPLPDPGDKLLDIVPVDYVVRAAHAIGRHPDAASRTFHLASQEEVRAQRVFDMIAEAGGRRTRRTFIPTQVASAVLRTPGIERLVHEPRAFMQQLTCSARYDTRNTRRFLDDGSVVCPPLESYISTWVAAVQQHLRRRRGASLAARSEDDPLL